MDATSFGHGAKPIWPWPERKLRMDTQDGVEACNTFRAGGTGIGRHRERIAGSKRKVTSPYSPPENSFLLFTFAGLRFTPLAKGP